MTYACIRSFELSGERGFRAGKSYDLDDGLVSRLTEIGAMAFFKGGEDTPPIRAAPPPPADGPSGGGEPSKEELKARARELKIKLHGNEGYQKLQSLIAAAEAPEAPPPEEAA